MTFQKLRRPCKVCSNYFTPKGKFQKHCDACYQMKRELLGIKIKATWKLKHGKRKLETDSETTIKT